MRKGTILKRKGLQQAVDRKRTLYSVARDIALALGCVQNEVSINDVRKAWGRPDSFGNWAGAIFRGGRWEQIGHTRALHDAGHDREVKTWRLR